MPQLKLTPVRCKKLLKALGLKTKDFHLKCVETRRYPSEVFSWYVVFFKGKEAPGPFDPNYGRMSKEVRYAFILEAIFRLAPKLNEYQESARIQSTWDFVDTLTQDDYEPMRKIWNKCMEAN